VLDGYTVLVYNFIREGTQLLPCDECDFKGFDLKQVWSESIHSKSLANINSTKNGKSKQFNKF
jgi:hypothetical protein